MSSPSSVAAAPAATLPEFVTPLDSDEERLDAAHGESPTRYRTYDNIIGAGEPVPGLVVRNLIEELNFMSTGESCTFAEAEQDAAWRAAMQEEIDSIKRNRTWELANLPQGHRAITLKWVYKLKRNEAGEVVKHKARLVARGFGRRGLILTRFLLRLRAWSPCASSSRWWLRKGGKSTTWT
jgi:hypothetical protein